MTEQPIIPAVPVDVLKSELTPDRLLRTTNKGGNVIYVVDAKTCPNVMREIGRLREITFRGAGGGTGKECDIDEYDLMDPPCRQLIVWDPESEQILGGYRFLLGPNIRTREDGTLRKRMRGTEAAGNVQAKTGTVEGVSTLSGYCTAANGNRLCFSIMNQGIRHTSTGRRFQDRLCRELCR